MRLSEILGKKLENDFDVTNIVEDTRLVQQGDVCIFDTRNVKSGADEMIQGALDKGAKAVISDFDFGEGAIYVENPAQCLVNFAKAQFPKQPLNVVGVTGTNGKTSVAWFYQQLAQFSGEKAASIGTLGVKIGDEEPRYTGFTTPKAVELHDELNKLAEKKVHYTCMEVSSHGLELNRVDGVKFKAAAFTNITPDHTDFHGSMEFYFAAKQRLFTELLPEGSTAVLNVTNPIMWPIASVCKQRDVKVLSVGTANAELVVKPYEYVAGGMHVEVKYKSFAGKMFLPLVGSFQAENIAYALGLAIASGLDFERMLTKLPEIQPVPGRMENVSSENQPTVLVDYAHTPDALQSAIQAVKPQVKGKLIVVFGCGGDRDTSKRPMMGKIVESLADVGIITDDNPRTENADKIREEIAVAAPSALNCGNREEAIRKAIEMAGEGDVVLLAGKGHENGQIVGKETFDFDDRKVAKEILGNK